MTSGASSGISKAAKAFETLSNATNTHTHLLSCWRLVLSLDVPNNVKKTSRVQDDLKNFNGFCQLKQLQGSLAESDRWLISIAKRGSE